MRLEKVHWLLPALWSLREGDLRRSAGWTGRDGCLGPNVNVAAVLLGSQGNVPIERTALTGHPWLPAPVSA